MGDKPEGWNLRVHCVRRFPDHVDKASIYLLRVAEHIPILKGLSWMPIGIVI